MSNDLQNVWRAFGWVRSYYREIIKLCERVRVEFSGHSLGYEDWTGSNIEYANSKSFARVNSWLPLCHYQFFGRSIEEDSSASSMLAVALEHYDAEGLTGHQEPHVFLARFSHAAANVYKMRNNIIYRWAGDGTEDEQDGWRHGDFEGMQYAYRSFPLGSIHSLDDVAMLIVNPLVEFDQASAQR